MKEYGRLRLSACLAGLVLHSRVEAVNTFAMTWSTQSFGPDGPWHAVQIKIGTPGVPVALYPGGSFASHILSSSVCSNASLGLVCYAQQAGLYSEATSKTADFDQISLKGGVDFSGGALAMSGSDSTLGSDDWNIGNSMETLHGMDMALHDSIWGTLPDGTTYPISVGSLALGAPGTINQTFGFDGQNKAAVNLTLLGGWLDNYAPSNKVLSSNSYGMHIGSVSPSVPASLHMGGFDQNRALGTVSTQQGSPDSTGSIDMIDIGLNVITGSSPWEFTSLGGLLASGNSSIRQTLPIAINSLNPYLSLPESTCNAIAAHLPVKFDEKFGLYFWDTTDPQYEKIVSSPSTLSFTFRASDSSTNMTINVPFSLLNLTMSAPLKKDPTPYFPCQPTTSTHFQLGRAFLQAAFVGMNYNAYGGKAAWWLAQAPGPNTPTQSRVIAIGDADTTISAGTDEWADTWNGYWTPLKAEDVSPTSPSAANGTSASTPSNTNTNGSSKDSSSGLSTGAKAGIGIAAAAAAIAALIGAFMLWRRHRKNNASAKPNAASATQPDYSTVPSMNMQQSYYEPTKRYAGQQPPTSPSQTTAYTNSTSNPSGAYDHPGSPPVEMNTEPVRHELS